MANINVLKHATFWQWMDDRFIELKCSDVNMMKSHKDNEAILPQYPPSLVVRWGKRNMVISLLKLMVIQPKCLQQRSLFQPSVHLVKF